MLIRFTDDPETSENEDELEDDSDYALSDVTKESEIKQKRRRRHLSAEGTREREEWWASLSDAERLKPSLERRRVGLECIKKYDSWYTMGQLQIFINGRNSPRFRRTVRQKKVIEAPFCPDDLLFSSVPREKRQHIATLLLDNPTPSDGLIGLWASRLQLEKKDVADYVLLRHESGGRTNNSAVENAASHKNTAVKSGPQSLRASLKTKRKPPRASKTSSLITKFLRPISPEASSNQLPTPAPSASPEMAKPYADFQRSSQKHGDSIGRGDTAENDDENLCATEGPSTGLGFIANSDMFDEGSRAGGSAASFTHLPETAGRHLDKRTAAAPESPTSPSTALLPNMHGTLGAVSGHKRRAIVETLGSPQQPRPLDTFPTPLGKNQSHLGPNTEKRSQQAVDEGKIVELDHETGSQPRKRFKEEDTVDFDNNRGVRRRDLEVGGSSTSDKGKPVARNDLTSGSKSIIDLTGDDDMDSDFHEGVEAPAAGSPPSYRVPSLEDIDFKTAAEIGYMVVKKLRSSGIQLTNTQDARGADAELPKEEPKSVVSPLSRVRDDIRQTLGPNCAARLEALQAKMRK